MEAWGGGGGGGGGTSEPAGESGAEGGRSEESRPEGEGQRWGEMSCILSTEGAKSLNSGQLWDLCGHAFDS